MAMQNENAVKYAELTDEHIKDVKVGIEMFIKSNEYWDKFVNHSSVPRGHKVFTSRRLLAPKVDKNSIKTRAEFVAPRPTKIAVATFERTVENYGDKAIYSREDLQYHFDNTVANIRATLQEIARQKLDFIKGEPFFKSKAVITAETTILATAEKAAIILRKNKANRWDGTHYLAHITPEELNILRGEISAKGDRLSEPVKKELDGRTYDVYSYGDFMYSVTVSDLMYKNASTQYIVFMGKRGVDGASPIDVAKLQGESGIEVINNGLGSGVLVDEDGNITSDDNKQQGSVALNMDGLGACVSDDLCILDCEFSASEIKMQPLNVSELSGFSSTSPASSLTITAVKKSDGAAIASPTVTVKQKSSSGTSVTASSGTTFPVTASDTYYVKVAKTGYTDVEMIIVAPAGATNLAVAMEASA